MSAVAAAPLGGLPTLALRGLSGDLTDSHLRDGAGWLLDPRQPRPAVLAFDPGASTGWGLLTRRAGYKGGTLDRSGMTAKTFLESVDALLGGFVGMAQGRTVEHFVGVAQPVVCDEIDPARLVVVEDTFLFRPRDADGNDKSNPKTLAAMARNVGSIIALATLRGLPCWRVYPNTWQSKLLGKIRRDQGKQLSLARARAHFGMRIENDHQSDAALLALYARGGSPVGVGKA